VASAPPDPDELHKLVIVLDGKRLKGGKNARADRYYEYMKKMKALARAHGAKVVTKELAVKQAVINERKRKLNQSRRRKKK
jgi:hypothetical protein